MSRHALKYLATAILLGAMVAFATMGVAAEKPTRLVCDIWPPYQTQVGDEVQGFSTEIVRAVYQRLNAPIESIMAYPWKRTLQILESGNAEALFSANHTIDRETFAFYPAEILFESPWVIWTKGSKNIQSLEDLKGETVGVVMGYSYTPSFWDFIQTYCKVEEVTADDINFKKLNIGRLDAIVAEYGNGRYLVEQMRLEGITPHKDIIIKKDGLHIIFSRKNVSRDFVRRFSDELKLFKTTEQYKALRHKYLGE